MSKIKLGEQLASLRKAHAVITGAEKPPSVTREREYLASCTLAAIATLEWLRDNETEVRAAITVKKEGAAQ